MNNDIYFFIDCYHDYYRGVTCNSDFVIMSTCKVQGYVFFFIYN